MQIWQKTKNGQDKLSYPLIINCIYFRTKRNEPPLRQAVLVF
jgi:hypothetical protein